MFGDELVEAVRTSPGCGPGSSRPCRRPPATGTDEQSPRARHHERWRNWSPQCWWPPMLNSGAVKSWMANCSTRAGHDYFIPKSALLFIPDAPCCAALRLAQPDRRSRTPHSTPVRTPRSAARASSPPPVGHQADEGSPQRRPPPVSTAIRMPTPSFRRRRRLIAGLDDRPVPVDRPAERL